MHTIIVSGASTIIGHGILKSLRQAFPKFRLIGTSIYDDSAAFAFCDIFEKAPLTNSEGYIEWFIGIIKKYNVSLAIPGIELDVSTWNTRRVDIEQSGVKLILNNHELIKLCADKWLFYKFLVKHDSPFAISSALEFDEGRHMFPLLLKPRKGSGSKGVSIVEKREQLEKILIEQQNSMIIQPIVGSGEEEYTVAGFFDFDSRLCAYITLKRKLSLLGFTEYAETVEIDGVKNALMELAEIFKPVGPTNFQFRMDGDQLKLLEINPRISSSTSIRTAFGFNESAMSVELMLKGICPEQPLTKSGRAFRYVEDCIYYDSANL